MRNRLVIIGLTAVLILVCLMVPDEGDGRPDNLGGSLTGSSVDSEADSLSSPSQPERNGRVSAGDEGKGLARGRFAFVCDGEVLSGIPVYKSSFTKARPAVSFEDSDILALSDVDGVVEVDKSWGSYDEIWVWAPGYLARRLTLDSGALTETELTRSRTLTVHCTFTNGDPVDGAIIAAATSSPGSIGNVSIVNHKQGMATSNEGYSFAVSDENGRATLHGIYPDGHLYTSQFKNGAYPSMATSVIKAGGLDLETDLVFSEPVVALFYAEDYDSQFSSISIKTDPPLRFLATTHIDLPPATEWDELRQYAESGHGTLLMCAKPGSITSAAKTRAVGAGQAASIRVITETGVISSGVVALRRLDDLGTPSILQVDSRTATDYSTCYLQNSDGTPLECDLELFVRCFYGQEKRLLEVRSGEAKRIPVGPHRIFSRIPWVDELLGEQMISSPGIQDVRLFANLVRCTVISPGDESISSGTRVVVSGDGVRKKSFVARGESLDLLLPEGVLDLDIYPRDVSSYRVTLTVSPDTKTLKVNRP